MKTEIDLLSLRVFPFALKQLWTLLNIPKFLHSYLEAHLQFWVLSTPPECTTTPAPASGNAKRRKLLGWHSLSSFKRRGKREEKTYWNPHKSINDVKAVPHCLPQVDKCPECLWAMSTYPNPTCSSFLPLSMMTYTISLVTWSNLSRLSLFPGFGASPAYLLKEAEWETGKQLLIYI